MGLDPLSIGLLAVSAVGTATSFDQSRRAAKAQERGQEIESARQEAEAVRQRRQQARQARVRRAQVRQAAAATGTTGSSGAAGAASGVTALEAAGSSFLSGQQVATSAISRQNQRAADSAFRSQIAGQIASLAGTASNMDFSNPTGTVSTATPTSDIGGIGKDIFG